MYLAELHGKLSQKTERMEDILTSNVFSFFKYSSREIFLKNYLNNFGINISNQEANEAEFSFWPRYEENTEPDLVIIVGNYYLLIEAKYFSDFGGETKETKAQLLREIENGKLEAGNYRKEFILIAITADYYYKQEKFKIIPNEYYSYLRWTNWQAVASFLNQLLESGVQIKKQEQDFALDLYNLLDKKNLRDFQGIERLFKEKVPIKMYGPIFFEAKTAKFRGSFIGFEVTLSFKKRIAQLTKAPIFLEPKTTKFRGDFIGFIKSLPVHDKVPPIKKTLFLSRHKKTFTSLMRLAQLQYTEIPLFNKEVYNHATQK